ncbi:hypothetical protein ES703_74202 [subsurface metagenome]
MDFFSPSNSGSCIDKHLRKIAYFDSGLRIHVGTECTRIRIRVRLHIELCNLGIQGDPVRFEIGISPDLQLG